MIEISDVFKIHRQGERDVRALNGLTCRLEAGTMTFIVGPSGSGKSTLLYLIGALDDPTSGEIFVGGRRIGGFSAAERDHYRRHSVGFIFQSFNLLKNLTALENVLVPFMPIGISAERRARATKLLEKVGLAQRMDHQPAQLSGGEQQRVAIARALLKEPELILADEPTGELDSQNGAEVFGYLRQLQREHGTTVVVVTHDNRYIEDGDSVLRMCDGRLAECEAATASP